MLLARNNLYFVFCVFALLFPRIILAIETSFQAESKQANKHAALFVFGDSVFDPGNNNFLNVSKVDYKANFPPYGETFFKNPTGRFGDGRLIPDFIAHYANLPYWIPYLAGKQNFSNGANFASGGACVLPGETPAEIYTMGGRKFGFQNVGPLGCTPKYKQLYNVSKNECMREVEDIIRLHNEALVSAAAALESQLSGYRYLVFDYFTAVKDKISNPSKYGFKEADVACCGRGIYHGQYCGIGQYYQLCSNPNEYLYFDGDHLTEHGNSQIAELLWNGGKNVTAPYNMKQLFEVEHDEIQKISKYGASVDE